MKKHIAPILTIFSVFALAVYALSGCGDYSEDELKNNSETDAEVINYKEAATLTNNTNVKTVDFSNEFNGINGCAVIYTPETDEYLLYNENMCNEKVSPYSTFKIISTLSGLKNGVLLDESSKMNYDGTIYPHSDWNNNLTLKEAFQSSCVWYFRQVIDKIGKDKMQEDLETLSYGNCDISEWNGSDINPLEDLNGFWLESSLKISPFEQVKVLGTIFEGQSNYAQKDIQVLKNIMFVEENDTQKFYGKTGTGINGKAWFVGFLETIDGRTYFAVYLNDDTNQNEVSGSKAKEIAFQLRKDQPQ